MKVLFAVNSESISDSIIKKYQKEYKEILTYKNVYYFNAIIKELQKDKTYDRIVISEDLEPFANNNYDVIDKFLFEKLDRISDEATDINGNDIPIVLICTDRRSQTDGILIKLFGIGVYSAIIGKDRSIDEVCRLISMPRTKKEAKQYYRIESDDVSYQSENESDVSEVEIQNILMHYKRLGKNTERYVDSFNNIASQYTDTQLKVIAKFLPLNVKAVLEAESPKYQELMMSGTTKRGNKSKDGYEQKKGVKANVNPEDISFDAFNTKNETMLFSKPVVIPSSLNAKKPVKLTKKESKITDNVNKTNLQIEREENREIEIQPLKKGRGRPKKIVEQKPEEDIIEEELIPEEIIEPVKNRRGRPKKIVEQNQIEDIKSVPEEIIEPVKTKRGRPKKTIEQTIEMPLEQEDEIPMENENEIVDNKYYYEEPEEHETPNLFDLSEEDKQETFQSTQIRNTNNEFENYNLNKTLISGEGKIVSFVGTSKNGTSFTVNNLAVILSSNGIKTAILDTTENKNSYYIYTKNEEALRQRANNSISNLEQGIIGGINTNSNLTVYTSMPGEKNEENWVRILDTLSKEYSIILIDCDFKTHEDIFKNSNELFIVQSMDILTIQPMTVFLRELKNKNILDIEKLRIIINKYEKLRSVTPKQLVGGLANYKDPGMSFMSEIFNKDNMNYVTLPLDIDVYVRYLEGIADCEISTKGYTKNFMMSLSQLSNLVYPLVNKETVKNKKNMKNRLKYRGFSSNMDETLSKMKKNY